jgi:hypothetical protein
VNASALLLPLLTGLFSFSPVSHGAPGVDPGLAERTLDPVPVLVGDDPVIENLLAFARLYGYVRCFHPSDEAALERVRRQDRGGHVADPSGTRPAAAG